MNLYNYNKPHKLLVYEAGSEHRTKQFIVHWREGRLRDVETGLPIQLAPGSTALICCEAPSQTYKKTA